MKILFYRYGSICEPDIIHAFLKMGLTVLEDTTEITNKSISDADRLLAVEKVISEQQPLFVFSINFYPVIADICHIYHTLYLCWTVDSPVPELFSSSIRHKTNRIFLFDQAQYQTFVPYNPDCIYYLPLASCTERFDKVIASISKADLASYACDIAFIGSLYSEKNPLLTLSGLSDHTKGYIQGLVEASLKVYGYNPVEEALTDAVITDIKKNDPNFFTLKKSVTDPDRYVAAHGYIGMEISQAERIRTLNRLALEFSVDLFTLSDTSELKNVRTHSGAQTLTEMPKIFHLSKINLNMTIKPIQTGLPLRIFDIMGCGGFLMTNYQSELQEYFEIGTDLEAYSCTEELVEKCAYYLTHEEERRQIAQNGYEKVCAQHTYPHRIREMIQCITQ
ncbi:MAG: glycosyltransferase [Lachnospiraceae bacterium]|nr:glycosyltransferase [Lachnospiraceae bacterium]